MLDIGWSEMAVIALVALVVIGPKDLPKAMKTVAFWMRKARKLASEFHSGIDQLVREAELEEAREAIRSASRMNVDRELEKTIDPTGEVHKTLQAPSESELAASPSTPDTQSTTKAKQEGEAEGTASAPAEPTEATAPVAAAKPVEAESAKA